MGAELLRALLQEVRSPGIFDVASVFISTVDLRDRVHTGDLEGLLLSSYDDLAVANTRYLEALSTPNSSLLRNGFHRVRLGIR